jgi:hypothetical protein
MSEFHRLRAYLENKGAFTEEEFAFLEPLFIPRSLHAGEFLQRAGEPATAAKDQQIVNALNTSAEEPVARAACEDYA